MQYSTRKNLVGVNGLLYPIVVEMDMPKTKNAIRSAKTMESFILNELLGKTISVIDENGNVEVIQFAKAKERVKKDGAKNSHEVIGKMANARDELQKKAIVNSYEITTNSSEPEFVNEHNHQWLDERGWGRRYCFVMEKGGDVIYPARLSIGRAKDGRSILYYVRVEKKEGVAIDKNATSEYAKGINRQAVKITTPSNAWSISHDEESVKQNSDRDSKGRTLTKGQQEYFADSKIRTEAGVLKVMYHGSTASFTVFDRSKAKSSGYYGRGFYFTDSESHAKQYGNSYEVYLNIVNPLQEGTKNISKEQLKKFVEVVASA